MSENAKKSYLKKKIVHSAYTVEASNSSVHNSAS